MKCYYIPSAFWVDLIKSLFSNDQLEEFVILDNFSLSGSLALAAMTLDVIYFANTGKFVSFVITIQMTLNTSLLFYVIIIARMMFKNGSELLTIMPILSWMKKQ